MAVSQNAWKMHKLMLLNISTHFIYLFIHYLETSEIGGYIDGYHPFLLTLCMLGNFSCCCCRLLIVLKIIKNVMLGILSDVKRSACPDPAPNCLQRLPAHDKSHHLLTRKLLRENGMLR